ncbi:MAG: hypothetical protein HXL00_00265 [Candidatus Nanosynbacter sp.]|nr:hypothetical protein [Candidatus Nanosynbacter sp.]
MTEKHSASLSPRQEHLLTQPITVDGAPEKRTTHPDAYIIPKHENVPQYLWNVLRSSGQLDEGWIDREIIDKDGTVLVRMTKLVNRSNIHQLEKCVPLAVLQEQNIDFTNAYLQRAYGVMMEDGKLQPVADTTHVTTSSQEQQTEILPAQGGDTYEHLSRDSARQLVGSVAAKASDTEVDNSPLVERVLGRVE